MASGHRSDVNAAAERLIKGRPILGGQWKALATLLKHHGEIALARHATAIWVAQSPADATAAFENATLLAQTGAPAQAMAALDAVPDDFPSALANAYLRGTLATNLGQLDEARFHLRRAVAADPGSGQAWLALVVAGRLEERDAVALTAAGTRIDGTPPLERAAFLYALGGLQAQHGDHRGAFKSFEEGARLAARERSYDQARDRANADAAKMGWTGDDLLGSNAAGPARAIFVTGLPRSGTTLIEQILASHSAVTGGEELGLLPIVAREMGGKRHQDYAAYLERGGSPGALRALYAHLLAQRFEGAGRVVDKTLSASRHLGLIAGILPDAPILWVRRDPLDCAWSAYRTWFASGVNWSWSLTDIAAHFRIEDALYAHWTELLGSRVLTVDYSALIADPEAQIARIVAHCGLELEPRQLRPHENERAVVTASVAQIREPINAKGIGSAAPYAEWLTPFIDAYYGP